MTQQPFKTLALATLETMPSSMLVMVMMKWTLMEKDGMEP